MTKEWKIFKNIDCPNCGDNVLVLSECPETEDDSMDLVYDDDECKCAADCGWKGNTIVEDENAWINDGNLDELETTKK